MDLRLSTRLGLAFRRLSRPARHPSKVGRRGDRANRIQPCGSRKPGALRTSSLARIIHDLWEFECLRRRLRGCWTTTFLDAWRLMMSLHDVWKLCFSLFRGKQVSVEPAEENISTDAGLLILRQFDEQQRTITTPSGAMRSVVRDSRPAARRGHGSGTRGDATSGKVSGCLDSPCSSSSSAASTTWLTDPRDIPSSCQCDFLPTRLQAIFAISCSRQTDCTKSKRFRRRMMQAGGCSLKPNSRPWCTSPSCSRRLGRCGLPRTLGIEFNPTRRATWRIRRSCSA